MYRSPIHHVYTVYVHPKAAYFTGCTYTVYVHPTAAYFTGCTNSNSKYTVNPQAAAPFLHKNHMMLIAQGSCLLLQWRYHCSWPHMSCCMSSHPPRTQATTAAHTRTQGVGQACQVPEVGHCLAHSQEEGWARAGPATKGGFRLGQMG